jgi:hypothetical protein
LHGRLIALAAAAQLALSGSAPVQRATLTLTDADGTPLTAPFVLTRSADPFAQFYTVVRVKIEPAPAAAPPVTFVSDDPRVFAVGVAPGEAWRRESPLEEVIRLVQPARANLVVRVGAPYNAVLRLPVDTYGSLMLRCNLRVGTGYDTAPAYDAAEREPDIYVTFGGDPQRSLCRRYTKPDQSVPEMIHTPNGAVRFGADTPFESVRAAQWRDDVREAPPAPAVWLARARNGATIKFRTPDGLFDVAPPNGDFPVREGPQAILSVTRTISIGPAVRFRASLAAESLFTAAGAAATAPVVVGYSRTHGYLDTIFEASLRGDIAPKPAQPSGTWSATGPVAVMPDGPPLTARLSATSPGTGSVDFAFAGPPSAHAARRVLAYRTLSLGCTDVVDGFGVAFADDGSAHVVNSPADADFYASSAKDAFRCDRATRTPPMPFTPGAAVTVPAAPGGGWYFPYGGVFFGNGAAFTSLSRAMWRPVATTVTSPDLQALVASSASRGTPLLIRTRTGRLVKLLALPREMPSFVGLYAVSRSDGSFAY